MGVKFDNEILKLWFLNTLPDSWENLHVTLTSFASSGVVTMDYVKTTVLNEEVRQRTQEASTSKFKAYVLNRVCYRLYDLIEKKLVRSRDVVFMEDQTIQNIDKVEKSKFPSINGLIDLYVVLETHMYDVVEFADQVDVENYTPNDQIENNHDDVTDEVDALVHEIDVKTIFLHDDFEEEIYMEQQEGFVMKNKENYVGKLKKSLYGLKQASRQWYKKFEFVLIQQGFKKTNYDHCVFVQKIFDNDFIILLLYVDDMLIVGHNSSRIDRLKKELGMSFAIKALRPAKQILGMRIIRDKETKKLWLSQEKYIEKVLQWFHMDKTTVKVVKWILRYLRGTSRLKIYFGIGKLVLCGYTDSNMAGDVDFRKFTSGYLITFAGGVVDWQSRLQKCVVLSTTKAKFIAATEAVKSCFGLT
ncbi:Reverse transcriptase [Theobroma cacao]|nr:Reverse transcriptase [Theobroma cacao]